MIPRTAIPSGSEELLSLLSSIRKDREEERDHLQRQLADYLGARQVFVLNAGRSALYVALKALELKTGEQVIVPAYTCTIVFEVLLRLGLKPILVDIDPQTYNIDPNLISKSIGSKARAIIAVHLFGRLCDMNEIAETARKHGLFLIEDAAQALGAENRGTSAGTFGDVAILSFGPGKSISSGEGGALVVNNQELADRIRENQASLPDPDVGWYFHVLRNVLAMKFLSNHRLYGLIRDYLDGEVRRIDRQITLNCIALENTSIRAGLNPTIKVSRMPVISAAICRIQLKKLDELNRKRRRNASILTYLLREIADTVQLPEIGSGLTNIFTRYPVRLPMHMLQKTKKELIRQGVDVETPYPYLRHYLHSHPDESHRYAEDACQTVITLPIHPCLTLGDIHKIAAAVVGTLTKQIRQMPVQD